MQVDCLEITTVASCSVRCAICPQGALKAAYPKDSAHKLDGGNFVDAMGRVPKHVRVHFSGLVEPFLHPQASQMLSWCLLGGWRVAIYTTLVGMHDWQFVGEMLARFKDKVDVVCIHEADGINMPAQDVDVDAFVALLDGVNVERMKMGGPTFEPIDRAGLLPVGRITRRTGPIKCSYSDTYTHNVMLPNGDVHLCCMDYGLKHKIGNLFTQRWDELDRGAVAKSNAQEQGGTICRRCHGAEPCTT